MIEEIVKPVMTRKNATKDTKYFINPTGSFEIGGRGG